MKYAETKRPSSERERVREDTKIEGQFRGRPHSPAVIGRALVLRSFRIPSTGRSRHEEEQSKDRRRERERGREGREERDEREEERRKMKKEKKEEEEREWLSSMAIECLCQINNDLWGRCTPIHHSINIALFGRQITHRPSRFRAGFDTFYLR